MTRVTELIPMQEAIDGYLAMPAWVQAFMALFALMFVVMIVEPRVTNRRARSRLAALAAARGARVVPGRDSFTESFALDHAGRRFTVRRELRSSTRGGSYRGPRGHLLVTETPLSGSRWKMHGIDVAEAGWMARLGARPFRSGDAAFDARFTAWQDGMPVRDGWLDAPTRAAFIALFDLPAVATAGTVWVQEGVLQVINDTPKRLDHPALTAVLDQQAALATALETTAGWRQPAS